MGELIQLPLLRDYVLPGLDILLLAFLLYQAYRILARTRAVPIARGAGLMAVVYAAAFFLNLRTVLWLMNLLVPGLVIGLAIVFQPELRQIFIRIGQRPWSLGGGPPVGARQVQRIVAALEQLRKARRGALIVVMRRVGLRRVVESGVAVGAELSTQLLVSLFTRGSPLHDGAAIVDQDRVVAAGCFLPPSELTLRRRGTRHRAALGIAEESDAVAIVLSEETGGLSLAHQGELSGDLELDKLRTRLEEVLGVEPARAGAGARAAD